MKILIVWLALSGIAWGAEPALDIIGPTNSWGAYTFANPDTGSIVLWASGPIAMTIYGKGQVKLVDVYHDGHVKLYGKPNRAAHAFWHAIEAYERTQRGLCG